MTSTYLGGCLCDGVRYQYTGTFVDFIYCHCQDCRKASGSAFNANASIERSGFRLLRGSELLKSYSASPGKQRAFCGACGSALYSSKEWEPDTLGLRMGTLDTPIDVRPEAHQFVASKAHWDCILDGLPQYPQRRSGSTTVSQSIIPRDQGATK